ncbi:hypothetical protein GCM10008986_14260 [Salinibacillus aidingensis]|uniref:Uncharacterized protein n=1 Tax=Salinibacillus aidingensis TaxID=237684 RepID=A0ABN1B3L4_9BACI
MANSLTSFFYGITGVLIGIMLAKIVHHKEINWDTIGNFFAIVLVLFLFKLGLKLYKE